MNVRLTQISPDFRYNLVINDETYFFNSFWGVFGVFLNVKLNGCYPLGYGVIEC